MTVAQAALDVGIYLIEVECKYGFHDGTDFGAYGIYLIEVECK